MTCGIKDFAIAFANQMVSDKCRAATDKDSFRIQAWEEAASCVTDRVLQEILIDVGPWFTLNQLVPKVLAANTLQTELPQVLAALCLVAVGTNPKEIERVFGRPQDGV